MVSWFERDSKAAIRGEAQIDVQFRILKARGLHLQDVVARRKTLKGKLAGITRGRFLKGSSPIVTENKMGREMRWLVRSVKTVPVKANVERSKTEGNTNPGARAGTRERK